MTPATSSTSRVSASIPPGLRATCGSDRPSSSAAGLIGGLVTGGLASLLVTDLVAVTANVTPAEPPLVPVLPWPLLAAGSIVFGGSRARHRGGPRAPVVSSCRSRQAGGSVTPAVEARDLFRVYATREGSAAALQGLSLEIAEGEIVVVFGPSGSGKTTLLRIVGALDAPSAGVVRVHGVDLRRLRGRRTRPLPSRCDRLRRPALLAPARAGAHRPSDRRAAARSAG